MKNEGDFESRYAKLNKAQKEAVDCIEGPVMVIAGPGTGKTQILSLRIANILRQTDTPPDAILALTFTEAGVHAMRKRLSSIIGVSAYRIPIFTFHGFCNDLIGRFSSHFPELVGSRTASRLDQITLIRKVLDDAREELEELASFRSPYYYAEKVLSAISLLKREGLRPADLEARVNEGLERIRQAPDYKHEKGAHKGKVRSEYKKLEEAAAKNLELAKLYRMYEADMQKSELYDFDDMILAVVDRLSADEDLRLIVQEEYQYILADEHQDANGAQNRVLEMISSFHASPNLFIVGDDKQAIYRFQGASLENFRYFHKKFPEAKLITLEENYRSTQSVLDLAHKLIADDSPKLLAKSGHDESPIQINEYENLEQEARDVAKCIKELLDQGVPASEVAVFTRTNSELALYLRALLRAGVPIAQNAKKDALDDLDIEKVMILIKAAARVGQDEWLIKALHLSCFKVAELDIYLIARAALRKRVSVWRVINDQETLLGLSLANLDEIIRVRDLIASWSKLGANSSPAEIVSTIVKGSGLSAEMISKPNAEDKLAMLSLLLSFCNDYTRTNRRARLDSLSALLDTLDEYDLLETNLAGRSEGRVQIMTAHKSKGLEFDYVFIVDAVEGKWSGGRSRSDFKIPGLVSVTKEDEEADDRRLFYVALTRARKHLTISYPSTSASGSVSLPSRFLEVLPVELVIRQSFKDESEVAERMEELLPLPANENSRDLLLQFVRETLAERGLSVTGLDNYLECPWKYYYRVLLRVPEVETRSLMLGTAMHSALKIFFDALANGSEIAKEDILKRLELELIKQPLSDNDLTSAIEEGRSALGGYLDFYKGSFNKNVKTEFPIDVIFDVNGFELRLTGKLDKIEFLDGNNVSVVDYKTGRHKTRNEIEGKTKDADGNYKRQLVFYNLLLNRYNNGQYKMRSGVIDFVMPDEQGRYRREEFVITDEEVAELETTIRSFTDDVLNLSFWDRRCDDEGCGYCHLREMMSPRV